MIDILNKKYVFGILVLVILLLCTFMLIKSFTSNESDYFNITNARPNDLFSEDKLTPVGVIDAFFKALIDGDAEKLNEQYVQNYFKNTEMKNGYSEFSNQKISDVKVKLLDQSNENDKFYEVIFTIIDNSALPFIIAGSGEKTYFFNIIMENKAWKIKGIATSP